MRNIKFRGKTSVGIERLEEIGIQHNGNWVFGMYVDGYIVNGVVEADSEYIALENWCPVNKNTIGLYTGLKDRTGTEIYEGDILELVNEDGEIVKAICKFGNRRLTTEYGMTIDIQCFYFKIGDRKTNPVVVNYRGMHDLDIMEIRGNIYEDHELIGGVSNE